MEEFPDLQIVDRWVLRLDKDDASFEPWHAVGQAAQAEDLHGFLCCLGVVRAMDTTQARIDSILDIKKQLKAEAKAEGFKIECPKAKDYQGVRLSKCLPDGTQCKTCQAKYQEKHESQKSIRNESGQVNGD
jgi:hypothetical protein